VSQRPGDRSTGSLADLAPELTGLAPDGIAAALTRNLQRTNNDRHLRVRHRPQGAAAGFASTEHEARYAAESLRNAGGIRQVRLRDGGIGLLQIAPCLSPAHLAEPYIRAAFTLLSSASTLVIDLREGRGGTPETVAMICGHLLGNEPVDLQDIEERGCPSHQYWTTSPTSRAPRPMRWMWHCATWSPHRTPLPAARNSVPGFVKFVVHRAALRPQIRVGCCTRGADSLG